VPGRKYSARLGQPSQGKVSVKEQISTRFKSSGLGNSLSGMLLSK